MSSSGLAPWMTVDPQTVPCPEFGWYAPRYLASGYSNRNNNNNINDNNNNNDNDADANQPPPLRYHASHSSASFFSSTASLEGREAFFPSILHSLLAPRETTASSTTNTPSASPPTKRSRTEQRMPSGGRPGSAPAPPPDADGQGVDVLDGMVSQMEAMRLDEATRRRAVGMDWHSVTPVEQLWSGPALPAAVPPASDYARLLDKLNT